METCKICKSINTGKIYFPKEMMLGLRITFKYFECDQCGCLQLLDIPEDLSIFYPTNYYSLNDSPEIHFKGKLKRRLKAIRDAYILTGSGYLGALIQRVYPNHSNELFNFRFTKLNNSMKILDIGSGQGIIPYVFFNAGFKNILGIDPYIPETIQYTNGLKILKADFLNYSQVGWDIVMFNHSFEHLSTPEDYLNKVFQILKPNGNCIIRIPTVSSWAWSEYHENWVQLDAPRHFFLYSINSIKLLANSCGFSVTNIAYESTFFQFAGSEQYKINISLKGDEESFFQGNQNLFTQQKIDDFKQKAIRLNENQLGDSISVILKKIN